MVEHQLVQRCIETLLQGCHGVYAVYLDDILITESTTEEHLQNLDHVLQILANDYTKTSVNFCFLKLNI